MKQRHTETMQRQIRSCIKNGGKAMVRRAGRFSMSERQRALIKRILYVRDLINSISEDERVVIDILGPEADFLFRLTNIADKQVICLAGEIDGDVEFIDRWHGNKKIDVCLIEDAWRNADCIITPSDLGASEYCRQKLEALGYKGRILSLHNEADGDQFFTILDDWTELADKNNAFAAMIGDARRIINDYDMSYLKRIDKINQKLSVCGDRKTLVYCVGKHTNMLMELTNVNRLNIVGFADRGARDFHGIPVRSTEVSSFEDVEHIVVSSYRYQDEICEYLRSLGLESKIVALYDDDDSCEFYFSENCYAPDLCYGKINEISMSAGDVHAYAEKEMNLLTRNSDFYLTYCMYPDPGWNNGFYYRGEAEVRALKNYEQANSETAIVIQGPVVYDEDFTLHTIELYQMNFPGAKIILSTWKNEQTNRGFEKIRAIKDLEIVLSDPPEFGGILNVNYQRYSSYAGIKRAKELGIPYVIKTRTDFRLYEEGSISHVWNLTKRYPSSDAGRQRISILQPVLDVPYYVPDFVLFGSTDDMLVFWNIDELYPNIIPADEDALNPEGLLFGRYFKRIGCYVEDPVNHLEEYARMLGRECIVVDPVTYRYVWKKYSYENSMTFVEGKNMFTAIDWLRWLDEGTK